MGRLLLRIREFFLKLSGLSVPKIDTLEKYRRIFSRFLQQAKTSVTVVSGELNSQVFDNVIDNLQSALERGVGVRIVAGPNMDIRSSVLLELAKAGVIQVRRRDERAIYHFAIFDGKHVLLSLPHEPFAKTRTALVISDHRIVEKYQQMFEEEWSKCKDMEWSMRFGGFKFIPRNSDDQKIIPATTEQILDPQEMLEEESRINGTVSFPLVEPFRIYCDWGYFRRIRGGLGSLGGSALGFGVSVGVSKSLEELFWKKIHSKKNRLEELITRGYEKEVVVNGYLSSVEPIVLTQMEGTAWELYILKRGTASIPVLMRKEAFEIPKEQVDKITCSVTVYGELCPGRTIIVGQERTSYIKARAAVMIETHN